MSKRVISREEVGYRTEAKVCDPSEAHLGKPAELVS